MHPRAADLALLKDAVRAAGALALSYYCRAPAERRKADGTQVSEADLAVDAQLRATLTRERPDYGWLSEETADDSRRLATARVWIVDPIDGTRAFLAERPDWTIAAGLVEDGRPVAGVVYNPVHGELFEASEGGGARLNGETVRVRDTAVIEGAELIATRGFLRRRDWARPWPSVRTTWVNSVAYRLALIAAGRYDATVSLSKKSDWDLAAAHILVQEAGGKITTHRGEEFIYNAPATVHASVVAAGPRLHAALLERTLPLKLP